MRQQINFQSNHVEQIPTTSKKTHKTNKAKNQSTTSKQTKRLSLYPRSVAYKSIEFGRMLQKLSLSDRHFFLHCGSYRSRQPPLLARAPPALMSWHKHASLVARSNKFTIINSCAFLWLFCSKLGVLPHLFLDWLRCNFFISVVATLPAPVWSRERSCREVVVVGINLCSICYISCSDIWCLYSNMLWKLLDLFYMQLLYFSYLGYRFFTLYSYFQS